MAREGGHDSKLVHVGVGYRHLSWHGHLARFSSATGKMPAPRKLKLGYSVITPRERTG